ncbi:MAG: hypothetical protein Q8P50_13240 [Bacillota bacterium]|nr:hypothetical protein [Bacillota bacterium]
MSFDVQVHEGVLRITTAGAGTQPLMPEDVEYLHCVQAALEAGGLRYQVLDTAGAVREWLRWPLDVPPSEEWAILTTGEQAAPTSPGGVAGERGAAGEPPASLIAWRFNGVSAGAEAGSGEAQTLLSAAPGRSPHYWLGPVITAGEAFSVQVAMHTGMGPGGLLWRWDDSWPWSSLLGATPWGAERSAGRSAGASGMTSMEGACAAGRSGAAGSGFRGTGRA